MHQIDRFINQSAQKCVAQTEMIRDLVEKHELLVFNFEGSATPRHKLNHILLSL